MAFEMLVSISRMCILPSSSIIGLGYRSIDDAQMIEMFKFSPARTPVET